MILKGRTANNIELWESLCGEDVPKPVQTFVRVRPRDWYMVDEDTGNMLAVTHKPTIDHFEHQRSVRTLESEIGVERGGFTPRTEETQIGPAEFESTFSSEPPRIIAHVMTDAAANEIAKACGAPDAEAFKQPCVRCAAPTHSQYIFPNKDTVPMCPKCINECTTSQEELIPRLDETRPCPTCQGSGHALIAGDLCDCKQCGGTGQK